MATVDQVSDTGTAVRNALQDKIDDGSFSFGDRGSFTTAHLRFTRVLAAFAISPANGPSSSAYDPALAAQEAANSALDHCTPDDAPSISRVLHTVGVASDELQDVTA